MTYRDLAKDILHRAVVQPTARDRQSKVGPSELGTSCDYCLGSALTRHYPHLRPQRDDLRSKSFSLKAWNGTAVHRLLEESLPQAVQDTVLEDGEVKVWLEPEIDIYDLRGYGVIEGHVDLVLLVYGRDGSLVYAAVIDHKTTDMSKLKVYKAEAVPDPYVFQANLYAYGVAKLLDRPPDDVGLHFIPRDSNRPEDIWACFAPYQPEVAELALDRLETVWSRVQAGELESLDVSPECFNCNRWF